MSYAGNKSVVTSILLYSSLIIAGTKFNEMIVWDELTGDLVVYKKMGVSITYICSNQDMILTGHDDGHLTVGDAYPMSLTIM